MEVGHGWLAIRLGIGAGVMAGLRLFRRTGPWSLTVAALGFSGFALLAFWFLSDLWAARIWPVGESDMVFSARWGVYLTLIAAIVGLVATIRESQRGLVEHRIPPSGDDVMRQAR